MNVGRTASTTAVRSNIIGRGRKVSLPVARQMARDKNTVIHWRPNVGLVEADQYAVVYDYSAEVK